MKENDIGCTLHLDLQVNVQWAKDNPEAFHRAFEKFSEEAIQLDLFDVSVYIDQVGLYIFSAKGVSR